VNLVGAFGGSQFKIPKSFQKRRENLKKNEGKTGNCAQNRFLRKSILDIDVTIR